MSRSTRHTPVIGNTCALSDKPGKVLANRALRRAVHSALVQHRYELIPLLREVSNVWNFPKDGKQRLSAASQTYLWMGK